MKNKFEYDTFVDHNILKSEYDMVLADIKDEDEREDFIKSAENQTVYEDLKEYLTAMVEYEDWCSPRGVESLCKVVKIYE